MATFKAVVLKQSKRQDNRYRIMIRLTLNRKTDYIKTEHYVTDSGVGEKFEVTDKKKLPLVNKIIDSYEQELLNIGQNIHLYDVKSLKAHLDNLEKNDNIDFIAFGRGVIEKMNAEGRQKSSQGFRTVLNALEDYIEDSHLPIVRLNSKLLYGFEEFLKSERAVTRTNQLGKKVTTINPPLAPSGIRNYMRDLRNLFKRARDYYNDDDTGTILIKHYPFTKYKIKSAPRKKAKRNVDIEAICAIRDAVVTQPRAKLAQDVFMMMFYLAGMNSVDLYKIDTPISKTGRLSYKRSKTRTRRLDEAFISIRVEPEVEPLIEKYKDPSGERLFIFHKMYSNNDGFNAAINKGLKLLVKSIEDPEMREALSQLDAYTSRHTWSSIARNVLGISKDDIDEALNHVGEHALADMYIERDWSLIDNSNRRVLDTIK